MKQSLQNKKGLVQGVFDKVYDKYDIMNDLMSLGVHRIWKRNLINWMNPGKNKILADVACGTGDIAKLFIDNSSNKNIELSVTSTTGSSASLLNGVTLHSWAGIGLGNKMVDYYVEDIMRNQTKKKNWLRTKILIIDEVSMLNPELFEKLDILAKRIRKNKKNYSN